jgi:hypothetical protein
MKVPVQTMPVGQKRTVALNYVVQPSDSGLGDVIKRVATSYGLRPCKGCERRAELLNRLVSFRRQT